MEISQSGFLLLFVRAALAGICLGCLYECLALLRQMLSPDVSAEKLCAGLPKGFWKCPFFARAPLLKPEKLGKVGRIFLPVFFAIAEALFAFSFGLFHGHTVLSQSYHHSGQSTQVISEGALTCAADNTDNRNSSKGI